MDGVFAGLTTLDCVHYVNYLPAENEKINSLRQEFSVGGPAAVAACTYAAFAGEAMLITAIGAKKIGRWLRRDLEEANVIVVDIAANQKVDPRLSSVLVNTDTGDRAVISAPNLFTDLKIPSNITQLISAAKTLLLDGHHPQLALAAASGAKSHGIPVILDGGRWKPIFAEILPLTNYAILSSDFGFDEISGSADTKRNAAVLLSLGLRGLAVTRGAKSVRWWDDAGNTGKIYPRPQAVKNTLGAGDVLHGAFCYFLNQELAFQQALHIAIQVASQAVTFSDIGTWLRDLRQQGEKIQKPSYWLRNV